MTYIVSGGTLNLAQSVRMRVYGWQIKLYVIPR